MPSHGLHRGHGVALIGRLPSSSIGIRDQSDEDFVRIPMGEISQAKSKVGNAAVTSRESLKSAACKLDDHLG